MKSRLLCLLSFMIALMPKCLAQGCYGVMQPHYETYVSYNADADYLYSDVVVDGYTSQSGPSSGCNISGSRHTPQIYHTLNGQGGTYYGPSVYPLSYVSFDNGRIWVARCKRESCAYVFAYPNNEPR